MLPSLQISKTEAGLIYGSFFMTYTVFSPLLGLLADRINIRSVLTFFLMILGIGTLLMGFSSLMIEAMFFFMLAGVGASASWSPIVPLVQRWTSDKRRGITLAFVDAGASIGIAMSGLIMPLIVAAYGWRMGWKGLGALALFMAGINFFLVGNTQAEDTTVQYSKFHRQLNRPATATYLEILKNKEFLLVGLSYLCIGFSVLIPLTFIATYAVQELSFRYNEATRLITIIGVTSLIGKLVLGSLSDMVGRIKAIIICQIMIAIGSLGVICFPKPFAVQLSMTLYGCGQGAIWPLYALCAPDYFSKSSTGLIVGLWTLFLGIGFMISPIIAGWIADVTGRFIWSFMLAVVTSIISTALLFLVRIKVSFAEPKV
jgi:MFS family permease